MFSFVFGALCLVSFVNGLKEGDSCLTKEYNEPGTCQNLTACDYAEQRVQNHLRPTHCAYHRGSDEEIVCCPLKAEPHRNGEFRGAFGDTTDGIIRSPNMVCSYNGQSPVLCCEDKHNDQPEPEPQDCPKIPQPEKKIAHIAWKKCVEFQRYANVCERSKHPGGRYERRNACGMSDLSNKISGGVPALSTELPHMALLGCLSKADGNGKILWLGGGTLISDRFVLTAAHVLAYSDCSGPVRYVLLGALAKSLAREGVLHNVVRIEKHSHYKAPAKYYDIALLELDSRVIFSDFVRPACLALPEMDLSDERIVAGWGETRGSAAGGAPSDVLLKTEILEYDKSNCTRSIDTQILSQGWDAEGMICAGPTNNEVAADTCRGDSGGPLMAYMKDLPCSYAVRGIVSWGPQCGQGAPGVYTNVHKYLDWIVERVWPGLRG